MHNLIYLAIRWYVSQLLWILSCFRLLFQIFQIDRQIERQIFRQRDIQIQIDIDKYRQIERQIERQSVFFNSSIRQQGSLKLNNYKKKSSRPWHNSSDSMNISFQKKQCRFSKYYKLLKYFIVTNILWNIYRQLVGYTDRQPDCRVVV